MKSTDFSEVNNFLTQSGLDLRTIAIISMVILLALIVVIYLLLKNREHPVDADNASKPTVADSVIEATVTDNTSNQTVLDNTNEIMLMEVEPVAVPPIEVEPVLAPTAPVPAFSLEPKAEIAKTAPTHIPQDTILRRHYLAHIKYMLETVTFPRPTEIVLRRHYDHLITSQLEACVEDEAELNKLIRRYEEHRRDAAIK